MTAAVWWSCALLALASARIYDRCELARDLDHLGVKQEFISTWVCIAFHESRFDTAANNPYSGDHGLFQISELYWCGPGKACGVPCSDFRDDDISDDLQCALQIYEEHTRLQGDGFLAWVVYPQHCKHNTKKYLVDCDTSHKDTTLGVIDKQRALEYNSTNNSYVHPKVDELKPSYLSISTFLRGNTRNELEQGNIYVKQKTNWLDYKIDNIDQLKLPVFQTTQATSTYTVSTTTTTTTVIPSVVPRRIATDKLITTTPATTANKVLYKPTISQYLRKYTTSIRPLMDNSITTKAQSITSRKVPTAKSYVHVSNTYKHLPQTTTIATPRRSHFTFTSIPSAVSALKSTTTKPLTTNSVPSIKSKTTERLSLVFTTPKSTVTSPKSLAARTFTPSAKQTTVTTKTTQSIFDIYLRRTTRPSVARYSLPSQLESKYKLEIFSGGTTTLPPSYKSRGGFNK